VSEHSTCEEQQQVMFGELPVFWYYRREIKKISEGEGERASYDMLKMFNVLLLLGKQDSKITFLIS
jgi:hypothetical protein